MGLHFIQQMLEAGSCVDLNTKGYATTFLVQWAQLARRYGGHLTLRNLGRENADSLVQIASAGGPHVTLVIEE